MALNAGLEVAKGRLPTVEADQCHRSDASCSTLNILVAQDIHRRMTEKLCR
ncbi:MAG: hypothetical protein R3E44_02230 [Paracoccaceae bacterium]